MKIYAWDPIWGPDNKIYHLASIPQYGKAFWHLPAYLCDEYLPKYRPPRDLINCAGSFWGDIYLGSASIVSNPQAPEDQVLFLIDSRFEGKPIYFRPSALIKEPNPLLSMAKINGAMRIPFRDPSLMPSGKIAVVTGGTRWGCPVGNICEIEISNPNIKLCRETILDASMLKFHEIERPTFVDDLMFFSINYDLPTLHVAKLGKDNLYSYHSEVADSKGCYGPAIDKYFRLLYWNKQDFTINRVPEKSNLLYRSGMWRLIRDDVIYQPSHSAVSSFLVRYHFGESGSNAPPL